MKQTTGEKIGLAEHAHSNSSTCTDRLVLNSLVTDSASG